MLSEINYQQKIEHNKKPIIDKDFLDLSENELKQFVNDVQTKYFYYKKDGVNVACGKEQNNKDGKFDVEMFACRKLVEYGHEVFLLPENYAKDFGKNVKIHGDTITDKRTLELKRTLANIQGNYRKAKHQASDVFIHVQNDLSKENALRQIKNAIRSMEQNNKANINYAGRVYLYFETRNDFTLFEFDEKGNAIEVNPAKKIGLLDLQKPGRSKSTKAEHRP